ncbi:MAG: hypothetical protein AAF628_04910 [Planctomycetota bacterium]
MRRLLFGGHLDGAPRGDTWLCDGATWQASTATEPPAQLRHAMCYDATRERVVLFGGATALSSEPAFADTWEWDGAVWSLLQPSTQPPAMENHGMAFDAARGVVVMYSPQNGTWEWDGYDWRQAPAIAVGALLGSSIAYDTERSAVAIGTRDRTTDRRDQRPRHHARLVERTVPRQQLPDPSGRRQPADPKNPNKTWPIRATLRPG